MTTLDIIPKGDKNLLSRSPHLSTSNEDGKLIVTLSQDYYIVGHWAWAVLTVVLYFTFRTVAWVLLDLYDSEASVGTTVLFHLSIFAPTAFVIGIFWYYLGPRGNPITLDRENGEIRHGKRVIGRTPYIYEIAIDSCLTGRTKDRAFRLELRLLGGKIIALEASSPANLDNLVEVAEKIAAYCKVDLFLHPEVSKRQPY